jgi:lipopolysaccharide/colanic/teichoic acid biosynthesis glycosyltransferase
LGVGRVLGKRLIDLLLATVGLLLSAPILLAAGVAIRIESGGSPIFRQRRVGMNGKPFDVFKLRTMVKRADELKDGLRTHNESDGSLFKIRNDPRITRTGRALRRFSLDEVPQLWNVLRGEMSLVGPRPLPIEDYDFGFPGMVERLAVPPGLTGLWQISGRSELGIAELVRLDLDYVSRGSMALDISILLRTVPTVIRGKGAY